MGVRDGLFALARRSYASFQTASGESPKKSPSARLLLGGIQALLDGPPLIQHLPQLSIRMVALAAQLLPQEPEIAHVAPQLRVWRGGGLYIRFLNGKGCFLEM